jgi:hypothetical protein
MLALTRTRRRPIRRPPPITIARLVSELRELPEGVWTPVAAGLLLIDVAEAFGHDRRHVAGLFGLDLPDTSARAEVPA